MKKRSLAALLCALMLLCCVNVFADTQESGGLGDAADIIIGDQSDTEVEPVTTPPVETDPPVTETSAPVTTAPPETTRVPETTPAPETTVAPETTETEEVTDPAVEETTGVETETETEKPSETTKKPNETTKTPSNTTSRDTTASPETDKKTDAVTTDKESDNKESKSRFSSASHVVAFILGIPAIVSFYAFVLIVARRFIYKSEEKTANVKETGNAPDDTENN